MDDDDDNNLVLGESTATQQMVDAVRGKVTINVSAQILRHGHFHRMRCDDLTITMHAPQRL